MLGFHNDDDYVRAADVLQVADFTEAAIRRTLGREDILTMPATDVPLVLRRTSDLSPLDTFTRLLFLGVPVPAEAVRLALAPMSLDTWVQAGLIQPPDSAGHVEPRVQFWPIRDLLLAVDLPWRRSTAPDADFVVPPGPLTLMLANMMIRKPCERMLDLGTGSGMLALSAAAHVETVVATDMNERAIAFTQFNARLNRIANIECRTGDLFEPVAQQLFQLIVCNPPFVISPTQRFLFRDSGQRGDLFCRRLVPVALAHLESDGFFQFTANVAHRAGYFWKSDLEEWFADLGCEVLVLAERTEDASEYALTWILGTETKVPAEVAQRYETWMAYFERERIEAVSYLFITLRRSAAGSAWIQIDDPPCRIVGPCGDELLQFFQCRSAFGSDVGTNELLGRRLTMAPQIRLVQEYVATPSGLDLCHIEVKKTGGLQYPLTVHRNVAHLLAGCDGSRTVREIVEELGRELGIDLDRAVTLVLPVVRMLLERSVLVATEDLKPKVSFDS
jgi:hypothetical protein